MNTATEAARDEPDPLERLVVEDEKPTIGGSQGGV
jgi:hypothetical protein